MQPGAGTPGRAVVRPQVRRSGCSDRARPGRRRPPSERAMSRRGWVAGSRTMRAEGFAPNRKPDPNPDPKPAPAKSRPIPRAETQPEPVRAPAQPARIRTRHYGILLLAFLLIVLPGIVSGVYLWKFADDQYVSEAGFAIRTESTPSPFEFLGALVGGSSTTGKDMDILNRFRDQPATRGEAGQGTGSEEDLLQADQRPIFRLQPEGCHDRGSGELLEPDGDRELRQHHRADAAGCPCFHAEDAQKIATAVLHESSADDQQDG